MAANLDAWLEGAPDDAAGVARALGDIARARDMIRIRKDRRPIRLAERYGLSQEFSEEACPRGRG